VHSVQPQPDKLFGIRTDKRHMYASILHAYLSVRVSLVELPLT